MARPAQNFEKKLIGFFPGDIDTIRQAYPDLSYNGIIRSIIHQYAEGLRTGKLKPLQFNPTDIKV